jgi:hypothetical protein
LAKMIRLSKTLSAMPLRPPPAGNAEAAMSSPFVKDKTAWFPLRRRELLTKQLPNVVVTAHLWIRVAGCRGRL